MNLDEKHPRAYLQDPEARKELAHEIKSVRHSSGEGTSGETKRRNIALGLNQLIVDKLRLSTKTKPSETDKQAVSHLDNAAFMHMPPNKDKVHGWHIKNEEKIKKSRTLKNLNPVGTAMKDPLMGAYMTPFEISASKNESFEEFLENRFNESKPSYIAYTPKAEGGREAESSSVHPSYSGAVQAAGEKGRVEHNWPGEKSHGAILYKSGKHLKPAVTKPAEPSRVSSQKGGSKYGGGINPRHEAKETPFDYDKLPKPDSPKSISDFTAFKPKAKKEHVYDWNKIGEPQGVKDFTAFKKHESLESFLNDRHNVAKEYKTAPVFQLEQIVDKFIEDTLTGDVASLPLPMGAHGGLNMKPEEELERRKKKYRKLTQIATSMAAAGPMAS